MVIDNDFGLYSCRGKCRPQVLPDEKSLICSRHYHTWIVATIEGLILDSNGINVNTLCLHGLDILHKIVRVGFKPFMFQASSHRCIVGLHP